MKKLFFLLSFSFLFLKAQAQELAYVEPHSSFTTLVEYGVASVIKESTILTLDVDIRHVERSWSTKATFTTKQTNLNFSKGTKGYGLLEITGSRTGRLKITEVRGKKLSKPLTVDLKFKSRPPSLG